MERTFNSQYYEVYAAAKKALFNLEFKSDYSNKDSGLIQASSSSSFLSWGEEIQIRIIKINATKTKIEVRSTSKAQLIDWGKNESNEEEILDEVKKILSKK